MLALEAIHSFRRSFRSVIPMAVLLVALLAAGALAQDPAEDFKALRDQAFQLIQQGKQVAALPLLEKLAVMRPDDTEVLERLGGALVASFTQASDPEERTKLLRRARNIFLQAKKLGDNSNYLQVMLEQLPLPKNLKRVPKYAGTHHETLVGSGYPRKLTEAELTVPMRIMAIADIFEALTACDRPYKKAKTLSESIKILSFFKKDRHIDPDLFDLLLTSGVYKRYAEKYLLPEQIDEVDISRFVNV